MKAPIWILLTAVVLVAGGTLAMRNSACKSNLHTWCAPNSDTSGTTQRFGTTGSAITIQVPALVSLVALAKKNVVVGG